jgi:hypothetical protein
MQGLTVRRVVVTTNAQAVGAVRACVSRVLTRVIVSTRTRMVIASVVTLSASMELGDVSDTS